MNSTNCAKQPASLEANRCFHCVAVISRPSVVQDYATYWELSAITLLKLKSGCNVLFEADQGAVMFSH